MPDLNPNGASIRVGQATVRTPGLAGEARELPLAAAGLRGAGVTTDSLEEAIRRHGLQRQQVIELRATREVPAPAARTRSTPYGEPAIELEVSDPGPEVGQVVLYTDEAGIATWSLPRDENNALSVTRGRATRTYVIRRRVAAPPAGGAAPTRGLISGPAAKLLQVLVFPLIDPALGRIAEAYAGRWESAKRPYRLRRFRADEYASEPTRPLDASDWSALAAGRALLFVHGTFARAHLAFSSFPRSFMDELDRRYGGRLIAFDHYTVSADPLENAQRFVDLLPAGTNLQADIICHSRGGLVSRALAEQQPKLRLDGRQVSFGTVVFAASPNAGCVLADAEAMSHFIDRYTNWLQFIPGNAVVEILEGAIAVVKMLAVGALKGLVGLQSMAPKGPYLTALNVPGAAIDTRYRALASNFEPTDANLRTFARNVLMDQIFSGENDLVVPTAGVWDANGAPPFPIAERLVYGPRDGIDHGGYFADVRAQERILSWLPTAPR